MMKKLIALTLMVLTATSFAFAQRVGYVNSETILSKIPEYRAAQDEIERISEKWQRELEDQYKAIEQMYSEYQAGEVLMPEDMKREKQEAIFQAERDAKEYREQKFGYNGELFQLQESKITPIQDRVFRAVETVSKRKKYDFVFDKAGEVTWLYTNAMYDLSDLVLEELGLSPEN
jgi:outer membrane protein